MKKGVACKNCEHFEIDMRIEKEEQIDELTEEITVIEYDIEHYQCKAWKYPGRRLHVVDKNEKRECDRYKAISVKEVV